MRNNNLWDIPKKLRIHYRHALTEAKKVKNEEFIEVAINKCKAAWSLMYPTSGKQPKSWSCLSPGELDYYFLSSVEEISEKVHGSVNGANLYLNKIVQSSISCSFKHVLCSDACKIIISLKNSKSKYVYGLTSNLIQSVIDYILEPIVLFFVSMIVFSPAVYNFLELYQFIKKGPLTSSSSFRPIFCIPVLSKVKAIDSLILFNQVLLALEKGCFA